jgi:integrase
VAVRKRERNRVPNHTPALKTPARGSVGALSLAEFAGEWLETRSKFTRRADEQRLRDHLLPLLGSLRLCDLRSHDVSAALREIQAKKNLSLQTAQNAYAVLHDLLGDALRKGLIEEDPRVLPADIWPSTAEKTLPTFSEAELSALTSDPRLEPDQRIWNSIAFYTGLKDVEVAQLRFDSWASRIAEPILPALAQTLEQWRQTGFEAVYGRPPSPEDWIVPRRSDVTAPHTAGSAYKAFRRCCVKLGIKPRSPHAVRNTFAARLARVD